MRETRRDMKMERQKDWRDTELEREIGDTETERRRETQMEIQRGEWRERGPDKKLEETSTLAGIPPSSLARRSRLSPQPEGCTVATWERAALIDAFSWRLAAVDRVPPRKEGSWDGPQKAQSPRCLGAVGPDCLPLVSAPLDSRSHQGASPIFLFVQEINLKVD